MREHVVPLRSAPVQPVHARLFATGCRVLAASAIALWMCWSGRSIVALRRTPLQVLLLGHGGNAGHFLPACRHAVAVEEVQQVAHRRVFLHFVAVPGELLHRAVGSERLQVLQRPALLAVRAREHVRRGVGGVERPENVRVALARRRVLRRVLPIIVDQVVHKRVHSVVRVSLPGVPVQNVFLHAPLAGAYQTAVRLRVDEPVGLRVLEQSGDLQVRVAVELLLAGDELGRADGVVGAAREEEEGRPLAG
mmetsp:Transcript_1666/g.5851  ORF Transcript_1666/g.5851 Transcript_1666/m.5851 type:complete len:250 (+) Transcript_1666:1131-1880(+)